MKVLGINHIGLAPKDPQKAKWFLEKVLGLKGLGEELVADQKTLTSFFPSQSSETLPTTLSRLEVLENQENEDGPIAKFLATRGGGVHHIALQVDNIEQALAHLRSHQIQMIDEKPRSGAHQTRIAFIHPKSTGGLLIELVEQKSQK